MNRQNDFDGDTVLIESDGASGLTVTSFRAIVLSVGDGWTLVDVNGCNKCLYNAERLAVHGSVDKEHWFDLADERGRLFSIDLSENLMGARWIRVKQK